MAGERTPKLRLVVDNSITSAPAEIEGWGPVQISLFPDVHPFQLVFVNIIDFNDDGFVELIERTEPKLLIDFRLVPRFDIGHLSRKEIFDVFACKKIVYIDSHGLVQSRQLFLDIDDLRLFNSFKNFASDLLKIIFEQKGLKQEGPLLLLFDDSDALSIGVNAIPSLLRSTTKYKWEVYIADSQ